MVRVHYRPPSFQIRISPLTHDRRVFCMGFYNSFYNSLQDFRFRVTLLPGRFRGGTVVLVLFWQWCFLSVD